MGISRFTNRLKNDTGRPPLEGLYVYFLAAFTGYAVADLTILSLRPEMLPQKAPPTQMLQDQRGQEKGRDFYNPIIARNIFNADGKIPPALADAQAESSDGDKKEGPAVPTQLPIRLLGTLVHANPAKSVATIFLNNRNKSVSAMVDEEAESILKITKIERRKVTFRNLNNRRLEYIEIPEDSKLTFAVGAPTAPESDVVKKSDTDFVVKRSDLEKYTSNLSSILRQARVVPNIPPGGDGGVQGFRFVSISNNSIYEKLGFKPGDVIKSVNGDPVNSPTKAMELYNTLKFASDIQIGIERDGREQDFNYTVE